MERGSLTDKKEFRDCRLYEGKVVINGCGLEEILIGRQRWGQA